MAPRQCVPSPGHRCHRRHRCWHGASVQSTPIERITPRGIQTSEREHEFDMIIYATGFDAVTGAYDRIDIRGVDGLALRDKWAAGPATHLGVQVAGFPNMIMPTGPQSGSASTNFPRGIELGVEWTTELLEFMWNHDYTRVEATPEAEAEWVAQVARLYGTLLMGSKKGRGWFTGYNSNVEGRGDGVVRHVLYHGGLPKYRAHMAEVARDGFPGIEFR